MADDWHRWSWGCGGADPRPQRRVGGEGVPSDVVADGGLGYAPAEQDVAAVGCGPEVEVCSRGELSALDTHEAAVEVGEQLVQVEPVGALAVRASSCLGEVDDLGQLLEGEHRVEAHRPNVLGDRAGSHVRWCRWC